MNYDRILSWLGVALVLVLIGSVILGVTSAPVTLYEAGEPTQMRIYPNGNDVVLVYLAETGFNKQKMVDSLCGKYYEIDYIVADERSNILNIVGSDSDTMFTSAICN